jgi:sulfonate transport system substrate-binding protein
MRWLTGFVLAVLLPVVAWADPPTIHIGWINTPSSLTPIMFLVPGLAQHAGKTYKVDAQYFRASNLEVTALAAGDLDIAALGYSTFPIAVQNARLGDTRIIADETEDGVPGWHSLPYMVRADGPIHAVADLKGRVLATNGIGSGVYVAMSAVMQHAGLKERRDYTVIEADFSTMKALLLDGKADLITASHPFDQDPELQAKGRVLFRSRDGLGTGELSFWVARAPWIGRNSAALEDFMEDYVRAIRWFTAPENRTQAIAIVSAYTKAPPERFNGWVFTHDDYYRNPNAYPDLKALQSNIDTQVSLGLLKASMDVNAYADLSHIRAAAGRLGEQ